MRNRLALMNHKAQGVALRQGQRKRVFFPRLIIPVNFDFPEECSLWRIHARTHPRRPCSYRPYRPARNHYRPGLRRNESAYTGQLLTGMLPIPPIRPSQAPPEC